MTRYVFSAVDLSSVYVDFNEICASTRLQTIELFNQGSAPISVDVLTQHSELLEAGERKAMRASEGFVFFDAMANESFSTIKVRNVTGKQSQALVTEKKTVVIQPAQRYEVAVASSCSISGVRTQNTNFSWGTMEDKISVNFDGSLSSQLNLYKKYFMPDGRYTQAEILQDFLAQTSGVTEHKRSEEVIFTLTSYPARFATTWLAIESLLRQTERPDRVNLNLFEGEFPGRVLPRFIRQQMTRGLEINWYPENLKVYLKLRPTILKYPNAHYVTSDDDIVYPQSCFADLYSQYLIDPLMVYARDVRLPKIHQGVIYPVNDWNFSGYQHFSKENPPSLLSIPESVSMTLLPNKSINREIFFNDRLSKLTAPTDDDLWIYASIAGNGFKVKKVAVTKARVNIDGAEVVALYYVNSANSGYLLNKAYSLLMKQDFMNDIVGSCKLHPLLDVTLTLEGQLQNINAENIKISPHEIFGVDNCFNPTIKKLASGWLVACRLSSGGKLNRLGLVNYSEEFRPISSIIFAPPKNERNALEDPRFVEFQGKTYLSYVCNFGNYNSICKTVFCELDSTFGFVNSFLPNIKSNRDLSSLQQEKNWLAYSVNDKIRIIYSISPLCVYEASSPDSSSFVKVIERNDSFDHWTCGVPRASTLLDMDEDHYIFFHSHVQKQASKDRAYFLGVAKYDRELNLTGYTHDPILFPVCTPAPTNEAFCILPYGAVVKDEDIYLSVGINDAESTIIKVSKNYIKRLTYLL